MQSKTNTTVPATVKWKPSMSRLCDWVTGGKGDPCACQRCRKAAADEPAL